MFYSQAANLEDFEPNSRPSNAGTLNDDEEYSAGATHQKTHLISMN